MQKKNSVIKNYILSPQKRILNDDTANYASRNITETFEYCEHEVQNMVYFSLFLLKTK